MASLLRPVLIVLFAAGLSSACGYGDGDSHDEHRYKGGVYPGAGSFSCGPAEQASIDTGRLLEVEPGVGAGAFIEYESGGTYRITTTCDTDAYGAECRWDIVVTLLDGASLSWLAPLDFESDDTLLFGEGDSVQLVAITGGDTDGFELQTEPGAGIRFDALLDDACAERFLFWVGDGALHGGAPSSVLELFPSEP